jgi:hypothetical protein
MSRTDPTDDGVLEPDEVTAPLDDERVSQLEPNRFVVSPDSEGVDASDLPDEGDPALDAHTRAPGETASPRDALAATSDPHGVDVTLKTDGDVSHLRTTSHDVREVFRDLLTRNGAQHDDDVAPAEPLRVMLATTEFDE